MTEHDSKSDLERAFDYHWRVLADGYPEPVCEYRFHATRKWRFDRAWVDAKVAVEIDGGVFSRGRHVRGMGYHKQLDKMNSAILDNWVVLRFDTRHIHDDPAAMVALILEVLEGRVVHGQG